MSVGASGEECRDDGCAPTPGGVVQRCIVAVVVCVRIDPGIDEGVDGGDIAELGGAAQLELAVRR